MPAKGEVGESGTATHRLANWAQRRAGERRAPGSRSRNTGTRGQAGGSMAVRGPGRRIDASNTPFNRMRHSAAREKQQGDKGAKAKPRRARELPRKQRQRRPRRKSWLDFDLRWVTRCKQHKTCAADTEVRVRATRHHTTSKALAYPRLAKTHAGGKATPLQGGTNSGQAPPNRCREQEPRGRHECNRREEGTQHRERESRGVLITGQIRGSGAGAGGALRHPNR